jgi:hypothetical protein
MDDRMDHDTQWADVRSRSLDEAVWFRSALADAGIEALIPDEHTLGLPLSSGTEPGTVRLLVRASDLERALEVLAASPMPVD